MPSPTTNLHLIESGAITAEGQPNSVDGSYSSYFNAEQVRQLADSGVLDWLGRKLGATAVHLERCQNVVTGVGESRREFMRVSLAARHQAENGDPAEVRFHDLTFDDKNSWGANHQQLSALGQPAVNSNFDPYKVPALPLVPTYELAGNNEGFRNITPVQLVLLDSIKPAAIAS